MVTDQTCGFCARVFAQDEGQPTCAACPLKGGCQLVRCPHCGYENPVTPAWLLRLQSWLQPQLGAGPAQSKARPPCH